MTCVDAGPGAAISEHLNREQVVAYLREHRERFRRKYHIRRMALIGSFARNEQRLQSDLDLLVDIEPGTPGIYEIKNEMRAELGRAFGRRVEIASERYLKPYYRDQILREALYV